MTYRVNDGDCLGLLLDTTRRTLSLYYNDDGSINTGYGHTTDIGRHDMLDGHAFKTQDKLLRQDVFEEIDGPVVPFVAIFSKGSQLEVIGPLPPPPPASAPGTEKSTNLRGHIVKDSTH